jgi:hypothetical protein
MSSSELPKPSRKLHPAHHYISRASQAIIGLATSVRGHPVIVIAKTMCMETESDPIIGTGSNTDITTSGQE